MAGGCDGSGTVRAKKGQSDTRRDERDVGAGAGAWSSGVLESCLDEGASFAVVTAASYTVTMSIHGSLQKHCGCAPVWRKLESNEEYH